MRILKNKLLLVLILYAVIISIPKPVAVTQKAWQLFAIYTSTIFSIIIRPFPMAISTILGLTATVLFNIIDKPFFGFATDTVWLIAFVFFTARAFIQSGLGERIAYYFIKTFGKHSIGLGYAITLTEFITSPFIPSSTARAGGFVMPIVRSISQTFNSTPENKTENKLGRYLIQCAFHGNITTSAIFLTGMVSNPLCQGLAKTNYGITYTWIDWATITILPGIISLFSLPLILYKLSTPELKKLPKITFEKKLGKLNHKEIKIILIFVTMLTLWIFGEKLSIPASKTALLGLTLCFITKLIDCNTILKEKNAWNTMIWLAILIVMSNYLKSLGFIDYLINIILNNIQYVSPSISFYLLVAVYMFLGYLFAGNSTHASALYVAFLGVFLKLNYPPVLSGVILAFMSSLFASFTHYGSSIGGIYFSLDYFSIKQWWKIGFIIGSFNLFVWLFVGTMWWKFLSLI